jgi:hypothetical protein
VGLITATTSDSSNPTINITGNSEGFHPTSGTAGSMTLLAPAGGLSVGPYTDVTITASGAYSNSPQSINPTLTAASTQAFVTGQTFAGSPASVSTGPIGLTGMSVTVGSNALTVTAIGRWTIPGNNMTHTLSILDGVTMVQIGPSVTVNCSGAPTNAYLYGTLSSPIVMMAGRQYFVVSTEVQGSPGSSDFVYRQDSGSTYATTGDGTLVGGAERNIGADGAWFISTGAHTMYGPLNFQYTVTPSAFATVGGTPFPNPGRLSSANISLTTYAVVSGTITFDATGIFDYFGGPWDSPPTNGMVAQWWVDGAPASPYITGPQNQAGGVYFPWTFDTHSLSDGTHGVFLQVVDSGTSMGPGAFYHSGGANLIVQNSGAMNGAQLIPILSKTQFEMIMPSMPDFVQYNGDPTRTVNFFDYPMPNCPPVNVGGVLNTANPYYTQLSSNNLFLQSNFIYWYSAQLLFLKFHEYEADRAVCTTYPSGGVCTSIFNPNQTTNDASYPGVLNTFAWDGRRYDARVSPYSTWVGDPVPPSGHVGLRNANVPGGYYETQGFTGIELAGAVRHIELNGNTVTIAGRVLNRPTKLPLEEQNANNLITGGNQAAVLAQYMTVGTMSGFTEWGGLNDLCYDGRFADGHILYVCNQTFHTIIQIDTSTTPATCTRIAGMENTTGYTGDGGPAASAALNIPYSLISGSDGILYICDSGNSAIRFIDIPGILGPAGYIYTLLGNQMNKPASVLTTVAASITASISGVTLNVTVVAGGSVYVGATVTGSGVQYSGAVDASLGRGNTVIAANGSGSGGVGTYSVYVQQYFRGQVAFYSGVTQVATATAEICDALGAGYLRPGTIMTVSAVTGTISVGNTIQSTNQISGVFQSGTTVIAALGGSQYTVSPTQTVASEAMTLYAPCATSADSGIINGVNVNWNPTTTTPISFTRGANVGPLSTGPYAPFPNTIRFAAGPTAFANAQIVLFQNESKCCRLINMAAQTVSLMFFMTTADIQWAQRSPGAFAFMDVDAKGTCGPVNLISVAQNGFELAFFSFDGTFQAQWYGNPSTFQWEDVEYGSGLFDGPLLNSSIVFGALAGYTWGVTFHQSQCMFLTVGFQRQGVDLWRVRLTTDPGGGLSATPDAILDTQEFARGFVSWNWGTLGFPRNIRPGFGILHGLNGFGHLGSDIGPTVHDMCVVYNGGSADYTATNITIPIATMVASGTTIAITLSGSNNAFISGVTGLNGQYVMISGSTNTGSGGNSAVNGFFKVSNYTDSQHFSVAVPVAPGSGTITPGVLNYGDAVLLAYIHAGAGGVVPRPEWDITGNDWRALSYYIRRQTTAGSYPTIAAIGPANADLDPPLVTSCSAVRVNSTTITVSWVTNKDTIGLACASSTANYNTGIGFPIPYIRNSVYTMPYGCWSPLEPAFLAAGVTHSATISWCPTATPLHFSVVVKDRAGNFSFAQDQTIT